MKHLIYKIQPTWNPVLSTACFSMDEKRHDAGVIFVNIRKMKL